MAKKFKSKNITVDVEVETLSGEDVKLTCKEKISGAYVQKIMSHWKAVEANFNDEEMAHKGVNLLAKELSFVYDREPQWFMDNLDFPTIQEILAYVAETIGGKLKKEENSS